ncbi:MAG: 2-isopropylmalate synthase [Pseudomonadales bacterium]|nr:2-isopropylmalate synthase [Pseudomonadales bacterium]
MSQYSHKKYPIAKNITMTNRRWPDNALEQAPLWCSVDLRDGNQALIEPMTVTQKEQLFQMLLKVGFKEIEVGFPAASQLDFDFVRYLIEQNQIPDDVTIQVLTQARPELIKRTFESLKGVKKAIVHFYNSTSTVQREDVFQMDRQGIINIATEGAALIKEMAEQRPETQWSIEYSPESFTGTEMDFAVEICDAVIATIEPSAKSPIIINLPATVEMTTPNIFADRIEWFLNNVSHRESIILSVHTHNDRGGAVAAAELALLAGADRVEGTLLGNGERTGNMDVVTLAMNLYSQGIDSNLALANMDEIVNCVKQCTNMPVHPRHPYAGELVYTAFSGSHQDAIKKCLSKRKENDTWDVAYLPIDPTDLGRSYQEVIRINSQSGKGGIAYVLEQEHGMQLPRWAQIEFSCVVQEWTEINKGEVTSKKIWQLFNDQYISATLPYQLESYQIEREDEDTIRLQLSTPNGSEKLTGHGNGVIQALVQSIQKYLGTDDLEILDYSEHALSDGAEAMAASYIYAKFKGQRYCGIAISEDIISSSINAVLNVLNQDSRQTASNKKEIEIA